MLAAPVPGLVRALLLLTSLQSTRELIFKSVSFKEYQVCAEFEFSPRYSGEAGNKVHF